MLNRNIFISTIFSLLILSITACTKNGNSPSSNGGTISFDANGQHVEYTGTYNSYQSSQIGVYGVKENLPVVDMYILDGQTGANNVVNFQIHTDSLEEKNYLLSTYYLPQGAAVIAMNGKSYSVFDSTQKFTLNITGYSAGVLNATFSGNLYSPKDVTDLSKGFDSIIVTNGSIQNMEMIY